MFWEGTIRKMKLEQRALEWIIPQRTMIMQLNNRGETRNRFSWVVQRVVDGDAHAR
jgi:hypothetical protein